MKREALSFEENVARFRPRWEPMEAISWSVSITTTAPALGIHHPGSCSSLHLVER